MDDPHTSSKAVLAVLSVYLKVCAELNHFRDAAAEAATTINALLGDLGGLRRVLESMEVTFYEVDDSTAGKRPAHVGSCWHNLVEALNDGSAALTDFDKLLHGLNKEFRRLDESQRHARAQSAATKIALFRPQVQAYTDTLQLSLLTMILFV